VGVTGSKWECQGGRVSGGNGECQARGGDRWQAGVSWEWV
jgi:hypothetical protein